MMFKGLLFGKLLFAVAVFWVLGCSFSQTSEMALLMKKLLVYLKNEKKAIIANELQTQQPKNIASIYSAKVLAGKKLAPNHKELCNELLQNMERYQTVSDINERKKEFNIIITNCVDCHSKVCPGPIEVIQSNFVE